MKFFGEKLQLLIAAVARDNGKIPKTNDEIDYLLEQFLLGKSLPIELKGSREGVQEKKNEVMEEKLGPRENEIFNTEEFDDFQIVPELKDEGGKQQKSKAEVQKYGFKSNLTFFGSVKRFFYYFFNKKKGATDGKLFLSNPNHDLLFEMFNLGEISAVKKLNGIILASCQHNIKFFLSPDIFKKHLNLRPEKPVEFANKESPEITFDLEELVPESLFFSNNDHIRIRLLLHRKMENFGKKMKLMETRYESAHQNEKKVETENSYMKNEKIKETVIHMFDEVEGKQSGATEAVEEEFISLQDLPTDQKPIEIDDQKERPEKFLFDVPEAKRLYQKIDSFKNGVRPYQTTQRTIKVTKERASPSVLENSEGWLKTEEAVYFEQIIIHMHGGGFFAMSSSSHQVYLINWAKELGVPVFSIDYRLAPKTKFPNLVNDVVRSYLWILAFIEHVLKAKVKTIIVAGDSAGGNLACVLTTWCIEHGYRRPDAIQATYPAASLNEKAFTPSFLYSLNDCFLHYAVLKGCIAMYVPKGVDPASNYYVSPLATPLEILREYPPVEFFICERDPLRDDALRFALLLTKLGVKVRIRFMKFLAHGILNMCMKGGLSQAPFLDIKVRKALKYLLIKPK